MTAVVVYAVEPLKWSDDDDRNGWYLQRVTITVRNGKLSEVIDRTPIARFIGRPSEATSQALAFSKAAECDDLIMLPDGWDFASLRKVLDDR